ncbi:hypothetical protein EBS02_00940 [bacterium]|nr:hypothetical protein [bacterium]
MPIANVELSNTFNQFRTTTNDVIQQVNAAASANGNSTIVARDASGSFTANNITATTFSGSGASLTNINASNVSSGTLNATRLATSGVTDGAYGNSTSVPQLIVDTYGRVTLASNVSINGINQFNYHTGNANFQITTPSGSSYTATIGQDLGTTANPTFNNLVVSGNLTVSGTTTTISANNLKIEDNLIYLNDASSNTNVDLGFAGNYNDGTYRHAGLVRDADDGVWKFFHQYTPEPDASANLDTSNVTFVFAPLKAGDITSNSIFYGNGSGLTTLNASNVSSGTLANARTTASSSNGASTIVARDAGGNFTANGITATSVSAPTLTGVASVATVANTSTLTADNTTNATNYVPFTNSATGNQALRTSLGFSFNPSTNTLTAGVFSGSGASLTSIPNSATTASSSNGASTIVARDASGSFTGNTITATTFSGSGASLTSIPNSATTASSSNGASTIVARDAGGNFTANNITAANLTTSGIATLNSQTVFNSFMKEKANVSSTAATGIINFDAVTAPVLYYTANSTGNFYLNVRGNSTNTFNSLTSNNEAVSVAFLATQGATPYYHLTNIQIDGSNNAIRWQGGSAPTSGNANSIDGFAFTIIKTANATYTVLGSQTQFKA